MTIRVIKKIENMFQTEKRPSGYPTFLVECSECGKQFPMIKYEIGKTSYCLECSNGIFKQSIKHGIVALDKRFSECWYSILKRCNRESCRAYKNYGGRGIKCEWKSFDEFYKDMGDSFREGLTIDRIDTNGNYCKSNCRRATRAEQAHNTRQTTESRYGIDFYELARKYNLSRSHIKNLVRKFGHDIDKTIYYLEHDKREFETYQGKTAEERARELGWYSGASFRHRLQRNGYSLEEFVKGFLSGKYKKRCGNYGRK